MENVFLKKIAFFFKNTISHFLQNQFLSKENQNIFLENCYFTTTF